MASLSALLLALRFLGIASPGIGALALAPVTVLLFKLAGLYDREDLRLTHSTLDEVPVLLQLTGLLALGTTIALSSSAGGVAGGDLLVVWLSLFVGVVAARAVTRSVVRRIAPVERCLVMGTVHDAERIRDRLAAAHVRATVVATLPLDEEELAELAQLSSVGVVQSIVRDLELDRLIIAPRSADAHGMSDWIRVAKAVGVPVSLQPRMLEAVGSSFVLEDVDGMTMLGIRQFGLARSSRLVKRCFDFAATCVIMLVAGPLMLAIAVAIRLDSRGPIFYRQTRVGRDGGHFSIFKFRSMREGAHAERSSLAALNEAGDGLFKITDDPRVTRVGRLLRRTSLDELPQILNVLRGEMSLVGPRPLVVDEDVRVLGLDRSRLHLTPGMTGPWQTLGTRVPMQEMVTLDYLYAANWSLWLDLKLLLRTVRHVARGGNV